MSKKLLKKELEKEEARQKELLDKHKQLEIKNLTSDPKKI